MNQNCPRLRVNRLTWVARWLLLSNRGEVREALFYGGVPKVSRVSSPRPPPSPPRAPGSGTECLGQPVAIRGQPWGHRRSLLWRREAVPLGSPLQRWLGPLLCLLVMTKGVLFQSVHGQRSCCCVQIMSTTVSFLQLLLGVFACWKQNVCMKLGLCSFCYQLAILQSSVAQFWNLEQVDGQMLLLLLPGSTSRGRSVRFFFFFLIPLGFSASC